MIRKLWSQKLLVLSMAMALPVCAVMTAAVFNSRTPSNTDLTQSQYRDRPCELSSNPFTLKVVTMNIHDLYVASRDRVDRMKGIAEAITDLDPDIVGFQESFIASDRDLLLQGLSLSRLKYHQYFPSATVGSGLLVVSAFPIAEGFFHRYTRNGKWYKLYHGDWWAGKGVALARILLPGAGVLDFYNTHAHAAYGSTEYDHDREAQMKSLTEFIRDSASGGAPAILVGDMNCAPGSRAFQTAVQGAGLIPFTKELGGIDHIFGVDTGRYGYEVLQTVPIQKTLSLRSRTTTLSDHTGFMTTLRIRPNAPNS